MSGFGYTYLGLSSKGIYIIPEIYINNFYIFDDILNESYKKNYDNLLKNLYEYIRTYVSNYVEKKGQGKKLSHTDDFVKTFSELYETLIVDPFTLFMKYNILVKEYTIEQYNTFIFYLSNLLFVILKWYGMHTMTIDVKQYVNFGKDVYDNLQRTVGEDKSLKSKLAEINEKFKIHDAIIVDCKEGRSSYTCGRAVKHFVDEKGISHILISNTESEASDYIDDEYIKKSEKKYDKKKKDVLVIVKNI